MKLDRLATIARIDELLADAERAHAQAYEKNLAAWEEEYEKWRRDTQPALLAELRRVVDVVRKGRYPKTDLHHNGYYRSQDPWGSLGKRPEPTEHVPDQQLTRLRAILADATADDFVTTASLRELGFKPSLFITT